MFVDASAFTNCTLTIKASQASREPTTLAATEATEIDQPSPNAVTARWPPPVKIHSGVKSPSPVADTETLARLAHSKEGSLNIFLQNVMDCVVAMGNGIQQGRHHRHFTSK